MTQEELERGNKILEELNLLKLIIKDHETKGNWEAHGFYRMPEEMRLEWLKQIHFTLLVQKDALEKEFLSK